MEKILSSGNPEVALDRRVSVIEGVEKDSHRIRSVSDLRRFKRVVLIGEPGMGKTAVLRKEAHDARSKKISVRSLINSSAETKFSARIFLDALDEYRSDGSAADKVNFLASSLNTKCPQGWILSCRSQDWRKDADLNAINEPYEGTDNIVVARLLPLQKQEAISILRSKGEGNPEDFYDEGLKKGASAFLENPLSLNLLQKVVSTKGEWPETRYEVFEAATSQLCYENNQERRFQPTKSPSEILSVAEELSALLIVTGSRALWSSNALPAGLHDKTEFLSTNEIGIERSLVDRTLDTPLFAGEGEEFEPIHRSVAEFLAARFLAKKAVGDSKHPRIPLSRVLALICSTDQKSPTELRGIYAWLAAHLERLGKPDLAKLLCVNDPLTVVAYGDAGAFSTKTRETLLLSLDRDDPFFRSHSEGDTALNTLAGEDLAPRLEAILGGSPRASHSLITVYDILTTGKPVESLRPLLRTIALDPKRAEWQRWRAYNAWMNGETQPQAAMRSLFDDLATEPPSNARENLRAHIAADMDAQNLTLADVFSIFCDYETAEEDNTIGRLSPLVRRLEDEPMFNFFDVPVENWRPISDKRRKSYGISYDLDRILSAAIRSKKDLTANTLWNWLTNARADSRGNRLRDSQKAVSDWLDKAPENERLLFTEVLKASCADDRPWMPYFNFIEATGRPPSTKCIQELVSPWIKPKEKQSFKERLIGFAQGFKPKRLGRASLSLTAEKPVGEADIRLLAAVADVCRRLDAPTNAYWDAYYAIKHSLGEGEIFSSLVSCEIPEYLGRQAAIKAERELEAESDRAKRIENWKKVQPQLRLGEGNLDYAALVYFGFVDGAEIEWSISNLQNHFTAEIADSIVAGFKHRAELGLGISASELGRLRAEQKRNRMETAVVAAVSIQIKEGGYQKLEKLPLEAAFLVLLNRFYCDDEEHRRQLKDWALRMLDRQSELASEFLSNFWQEELDARIALNQEHDAIDINLVDEFSHADAKSDAASLALAKVFEKRHEFPPKALRSLIHAVVQQWRAEELLKVCRIIEADYSVSKENKQVWAVIAFAISPNEWSEKFQCMFQDAGKSLAELSIYNEVVSKAYPLTGVQNKIAYHDAMVRILGKEFSPSDDSFGPRAFVQASIDSLAAIADRQSGKALAVLRDLPELQVWESEIRHAISKNLRLVRDDKFNHPTLKQVKETLIGGPPINASDLRAIMVEVLRGYQEEINQGDLPSWNGYWNTDKNGQAVSPKIENVCRDQFLTIIRPRLERFSVDLALSEAQRAAGRRADILLANGSGRNLPIEVKRHYNRELWTAISEQLQDYADDPKADGFGIYLVFWFGVSAGGLPNAPKGTKKPSSAKELEKALEKTLLKKKRDRFDVVVLDVEPRQKP